MTYKECPKCHQSVLDIYYICPNCGASLESSSNRKKKTTPLIHRTKGLRIAAIAALAIVSVALIYLINSYFIRETPKNNSYSSSISSSNKDSSSSNKQDKKNSTDIPDDLKAALASYAEKKVKAHLLSPSTAKFPLYSKYTYNKNGNVYSIKGYVDAKNSFGAELRKNWGVMVEYDGTYSSLICVVIDGNTFFD